jgi:excisionase family DNA binding protein
MNNEATNDVSNVGLVRVKRAAALLGVSPRTIWRMISEHQIKVVHVRRCTCVLLSDLMRLVHGGNNARCL